MSPKFELTDNWIAMLRALPPGKKIEMVFGMTEFTHRTALRQIRKQYPAYSERDVLRELSARRYGIEIASQAYPR